MNPPNIYRLFTMTKLISAVHGIFFMLMLLPQLLSAQAFNKQEVTFTSGDNELSGTLVLPVVIGEGEIPVLVYMGGIDEWGNKDPQRQLFIERNLEVVFPPLGIGVFYFDPRGIDDSDGRWGRATLQDFADDAIAAINFLTQMNGIDENRIGIIGHGEDGMVAQIVANSAPQKVKVLISLAGPVFDYEMQLINQYHSEYICNGEGGGEAYEKAVQKAQSHQNWVSVLPIIKRWRHMKMKQDYDPVEQLQDIDIPSLFVFGKNDGNLYPNWAIEELNSIFSGEIPLNFTIASITGANQFFHLVNPCHEYDQRSEGSTLNYSFRFREVLREWVLENL